MVMKVMVGTRVSILEPTVAFTQGQSLQCNIAEAVSIEQLEEKWRANRKPEQGRNIRDFCPEHVTHRSKNLKKFQ